MLQLNCEALDIFSQAKLECAFGTHKPPEDCLYSRASSAG
jgi:hypothetical protein